jgi:hypothetical protein
LAEILVNRSSDRARLIQVLQRSSRFQLAEFGPAAAAAAADLMATKWPKLKDRNAEWSRHRLKFDLQILAIAQVNNVSTIYTMDKQPTALCRAENIVALGFGDLQMPDEKQGALPLSHPAGATSSIEQSSMDNAAAPE